MTDLLGWTLDRTAGLPRSQRFTFGQRIDQITLDCLEVLIEALWMPSRGKADLLRRLNLNVEKLRVFWRLVCQRRWISEQQLLFITRQLDEIWRMVGGWLRHLAGQTADTGS